MNAQEQRQIALEKADRLRLRRAAERRRLQKLPYRQGRGRVAEILMQPGDVWAGAKVSYALRMPRSSGHGLVDRAYRQTGIDTSQRIRELSGRERMALAVFLSPEKFIEMAVAA